MHHAARILNAALHPLFMPVYTVAAILVLDPHLAYFLNPDLRLLTLGIVALLTVLFPLFSTLLLIRAGVVGDLTMPRRQERAIPYAMTLFYYALAWHVMRKTPFGDRLEPLFLGAFVALAFTALVTLRWKISAHMVGIGGLIGAVWATMRAFGTYDLGLLAVALVSAGALGTARLLTSDHTQGQVFAGAALGFCCTFLAVGHMTGL
jgi:hypothetical protein